MKTKFTLYDLFTVILYVLFIYKSTYKEVYILISYHVAKNNIFMDDHCAIFALFFYSIEAFVLEMQMEYSKLNLWLNNSDVADSWLMEYESHADDPETLGTTIRVVRLQLHENQVCI